MRTTTTLSSPSDTHLLQSGAQKLPKGCVLLGVLKSVENELRKRDMLGVTGQPATPLWFLAETERNIFLWRNGKSLDDHAEFSFWVDVPALISKRREQLNKPAGVSSTAHNPFTNPLWGLAPYDDKLAEQERDYLDSLDDLVGSILKHAEALSVASEQIRSDLAKSLASRPPVVIPSGAAAKAPQP